MVSLTWKSCERKWGSSQIFTLLLTNKRKPIPTALCRRAAMLKSWTVGDFPGGPAVKTPPSSAGAAGWTPDLGVKIRHASPPRNRNMKQKRYCNKFNKDFKKWCTLKNNKKKKLRYRLHNEFDPGVLMISSFGFSPFFFSPSLQHDEFRLTFFWF